MATLIAHGISLSVALGAAQALYPDFAPLVTLKAISYFGDGDLGELPDHVKRGLAEAAGAVREVDSVGACQHTTELTAATDGGDSRALAGSSGWT